MNACSNNCFTSTSDKCVDYTGPSDTSLKIKQGEDNVIDAEIINNDTSLR